MKELIPAIVIFFKLVFYFINIKAESRAEVKAKKELAFKEAQNAIQSGDDSALTSAFDKLNRL